MVRAVLILSLSLLVACGVQPEYVCKPSNCGGCCVENACIGVSGGCGGETGTDAGGARADAGTKMDAGIQSMDAGVVAVTIRYDYPKNVLMGCAGNQVKELCEQTRTMTAKQLDDLAAAHYSSCVTMKTGDTATIDCRGNCVENTYSCSGGGTYNAVSCVQVPLTAKLDCDWYQ